jgi:ketol-acid reductoisomerase
MKSPQKLTSAVHDNDHASGRIAVIGYGEGAGREHARRLRDRGHDVRVAVLPGGRSWIHATKDGFRPARATAAADGADVVVILVPEDDAAMVYWEEIVPVTKPGALVVFGDQVDLDRQRLPAGVDVVVIAMTDDTCVVSVHADATGRALGRAYAYLEWLGGHVPRSASATVRVSDPHDPFPHPSQRVL